MNSILAQVEHRIIIIAWLARRDGIMSAFYDDRKNPNGAGNGTMTPRTPETYVTNTFIYTLYKYIYVSVHKYIYIFIIHYLYVWLCVLVRVLRCPHIRLSSCSRLSPSLALVSNLETATQPQHEHTGCRRYRLGTPTMHPPPPPPPPFPGHQL